MGFSLLAITLPVLGGVWSGDAVLWGTISGGLSCFVFITLYKCLAIGPMGILSPVIGLVGASMPVFFAVIIGERVSLLGWIGIGLALASVVIISLAFDPAHHRPTALGLVLAVVCGVSVGVFFIALSRAPGEAGSIPMFFNRAVTAVVFFTAMLITVYSKRGAGGGIRSALDKRIFPMALLAGALDTTANLLFLYASHLGMLSLVAVIASLYPATTVLCARFFLKERMTRTQLGGLGMAAVAVSLLALAQA
jgi:drug/metabolite transporter (DMT)-like permease